MIDRIDFNIDLLQGGEPVPVPMALINRHHGDTSTPLRYHGATEEGEVFLFEGVEGFRAIGSLCPELMTHNAAGEPLVPAVALVVGDPRFYKVTKVVLNPCAYPSLHEMRSFVHNVLSEFSGNPVMKMPWGLRVTRLELALDIPKDFDTVFLGIFIPRVRNRDYIGVKDGKTVEVVWGAAPISLAVYDRRSRLEMMKKPTPDGPMTRIERRYTNSRRWRPIDSIDAIDARRLPHREMQSVDWIINMCADIEEGIFKPFDEIVLHERLESPVLPELEAAKRRLLSARIMAEKRNALEAYRDLHARYVEVSTMLKTNGYLWTYRWIGQTFGPRNTTTGNHTLLRAYTNMLNILVEQRQVHVTFNDLLRESIRNHHFNGQAPERISIPEVAPREWDKKRFKPLEN